MGGPQEEEEARQAAVEAKGSRCPVVLVGTMRRERWIWWSYIGRTFPGGRLP